MYHAAKRLTCSALLCGVLAGCAIPAPGPSPDVQESEAAPPPIVRNPASTDTSPPQAANPSRATSTLLAAADAASANADHARAVVHLERAVRIDPRNPRLWVRLSKAHADNGDLDRARQHARKAIALASTDPAAAQTAWLHMADIEEAQGNRAEAASIRRRYARLSG